MFLRARLLPNFRGKCLSTSGNPTAASRPGGTEGRRRTRPRQLGFKLQTGSEGARRFGPSWFCFPREYTAGPRSRFPPPPANPQLRERRNSRRGSKNGFTTFSRWVQPKRGSRSRTSSPVWVISGSAFPFGNRYPHARARSWFPLLPTTPSTLRGRQKGRQTAARGRRRARVAGACPSSLGPTQEAPGGGVTKWGRP